MKRFIIYSLLAAALGFTACGGDDSSSDDFNPSALQGQWCMLDMAGGTAVLLDVTSSLSFTGKTYEHITSTPVLYESFSGTWAYYPSNGILNMQVLHSATLEGHTTSYKVVNTSDYMLQLRNQELGLTESYHRFGGTMPGKVGDEIDLRQAATMLGDFTPASYSSSNNGIATVDAQGHVKITGAGTAFISMQGNQETVIICVKSPSRMEDFVEELQSTIDDIMGAHGQPNAQGTLGQNQAVVYRQSSFDEALEAIQYHFDEKTREVTRITTRYKDDTPFYADVRSIQLQYRSCGENLYGLYENFAANNFCMAPVSNDEGNFINYFNIPYYHQHGYY